MSYEKVYAPFDGVITARNTEIGALIDAGANAPGKELFDLAAIHKLRLYVAIPEVYASAAQPGATATLRLDAFPGEVFHGTLVRNANSIDLASRTLLTEIDIDNSSGHLMPGAYVVVHLNLTLPDQVRSVTVPANTLIFKSGVYSGLNIPVGFYTQILGVGASPDNVSITGNLHSDAFLSGDNATQNFWRGAEGFSITPSSGVMPMLVSTLLPPSIAVTLAPAPR